MRKTKTGNSLIIFLIIGALAIGAGAYVLAQNQRNSTNQTRQTTTESPQTQSDQRGETADQTTSETTQDNQETTTQSASASDQYITYSEANFQANSDKRRILFFHASWCPTCRIANKELTENTNQLPSDVVVLKTDYDTETQLKQKYGVTYQHTFVQVDENGDEITKWNGGGIDQINQEIM